MTDEFLFTVPSGEPVTIEPFHYAIVGQTQFSGKTTLIKRLSEWVADLGFKVLIWDTKETEADYAGFGREIPVCLRESTDSFVLIGLLESMFRRRLTHYYATLTRITEGAKGFDDIIQRAKKLEEKTRSSWLKDACRVLYDLLERLKNETAKVETVPRLKLYPGINRMVINDFSLEAQQLIVKNCFEDLLRVYKRNTIGVLDEAFKFIPQGYSSPATRSIMQVMTQGAKTKLFGWLSTQFLAVTDKGPLKACAFKFLGTQDHITEVKHTMDLIPEIRGKFTSDDIMKLKLGHWILVRKRPPDVRIVYALPLGRGITKHIGRKVAMAQMTPEQVRDKFLVSKLKEDEDLVYKEKYEEERAKREELEELNQQFRAKVNELKAKVQMLLNRGSPEQLEELRKTIMKLKDEKANLEKQLEKEAKAFVKVKKKADAFENLQKALAPLVSISGQPGFEPGAAPSQIGLQTTTNIVEVDKAIKRVTVSDQTIRGKVLTLAKTGFLEAWRGLGDVHKALIEKFGWTIAKASLDVELGRMVKDFLLGMKKGPRQKMYRLAANVKFKEG